MSKTQLTTLLSHTMLDRLERLRIVARTRRTNRGRGEHLTGKGGTSTEFCDYRDYVAGDDLRFVDWNIFARLNRPYVKQFHQEQERHVVLVVDASASMGFEDKLTRAKQLAAAFGMMALLNSERVSVYASHGRGGEPEVLSPCRGRASLRRLFAFLEDIESTGDAPLEGAVEALLRQHKGRGICVLLSDFLTFGDLTRGFNLLHAAGLEPLGIQILGPCEYDPEVSGDLRLVDAETDEALDISAADVMTLYAEYRLGLEEELAQLCRRRAGRFASVSSVTPVETILLEQLRRAGWIA